MSGPHLKLKNVTYQSWFSNALETDGSTPWACPPSCPPPAQLRKVFRNCLEPNFCLLPGPLHSFYYLLGLNFERTTCLTSVRLKSWKERGWTHQLFGAPDAFQDSLTVQNSSSYTLTSPAFWVEVKKCSQIHRLFFNYHKACISPSLNMLYTHISTNQNMLLK